MFTKLRLERFKSFKDAELTLGQFTVLVGANATGKSNIRDAFRFLHGMSRGYTVAEILGEKWVEGGFLQWAGIRGGLPNVVFDGSNSFGFEVAVSSREATDAIARVYSLEVSIPSAGIPHMQSERFLQGQEIVFETRFNEAVSTMTEPYAHIRWMDSDGESGGLEDWSAEWPSIPALLTAGGPNEYVFDEVYFFDDHLRSIRFVDFHPEAMRRPSLPGQTVLGDRGENLSSVLQAICRDAARKGLLTQWLQELLPGDVVDFEFPSDLQGKVLVTLIEANGRRTPAYSASDGTLRFLGMLAALLGPEPARFFFLEEIENGIHPSRLNLLIQLIEQVTAERGIQVVATTHSPLVLALLSEKSLEYASVTYRLEGQPDTRIRRLLDIPHAREVLAKSSAAHLHESGWFEDALSFTEGDPEQEHAA